MQASDLMSSPVTTIRPDATVGEAARLLLDAGISCLPVLDAGGRLVGILTHDDFGLHPKYRPLAENLYTLLGDSTTPGHLEEVARKVGGKLVTDVMRRHVFTVQEDASIAQVAEAMLRRNIHRLPVMRGEALVGIITRHDFLKLIAPDQ